MLGNYSGGRRLKLSSCGGVLLQTEDDWRVGDLVERPNEAL